MHADSLQECVKVDLDGASVSLPQCVDDLISGSLTANPNSAGTSTSSGISMSSSSYSTLSDSDDDPVGAHLNSLRTSGANSSSSAFGLPHYLYESTLNLLFALLKPDVLRADELTEFSNLNSQHEQDGASTPLENSPSLLKSSTNTLSEASLLLSSSSSSSINNQPASSSTQPTASTATHINLNQMSQAELEAVWLDKLLRAVFVRLFAQLFAGYRYCLLIIRINPKPVICFNKANFLGNHSLVDNEFMNRLLDSMSFQRFIEERGPSYRHCDVFDDLYAEIQSELRDELEQQHDLSYQNANNANSAVMRHLKQIAEKLFKYEYPHTTNLSGLYQSLSQSVSSKPSNNNNNGRLYNKEQPNPTQPAQNGPSCNAASNASLKTSLMTHPNRSFSKIKLPTLDAFKRIHSETFPELDSSEIHRLISLNYQHNRNNNSSSSELSSAAPRNNMCRPHLVPYGPPIETVKNMSVINKRLINLNEHNYSKVNKLEFAAAAAAEPLNNSTARKLEAINQCVTHIFENNFKEAKKSLNSAYRALRDPRARLHLCACLQRYVKRNQVILNNEQFEYVCKLLNEALMSDSRLDEHGVAYSILPLTSAFYRKLNNGTVDQCIYTRLQMHDVWSNMQFWEMAFFTDVQRSLRPVYLSNEEFAAEQEKENVFTSNTNSSSSSSSNNNDIDAIDVIGPVSDMSDEVESHKRPDNLNLAGVNGEKKAAAAAAEKFALNELSLNLYSRPAEKTALEICGEQMEKIATVTDEQRENYIRNEQGIIRSHVLHYITQMVNMKIPMDINVRIASKKGSRSPSPNRTSAACTPRSHSFDYNELEQEQKQASTTIPRKLAKRSSASSNQQANASFNENNYENESLNTTDVNSMNNTGQNGTSGPNGAPNTLGENSSLAAGSDDSGYDALAAANKQAWVILSFFFIYIAITQ